MLLGFLCKAFYRAYIHQNGINDDGIEGFLPSYFYVLGLSLLLLVGPVKYPNLILAAMTCASILFEMKQWSSSGILDLKDVIASLAGVLQRCLF